MAMAFKRKLLPVSEKVKIIQEVEKNPTVLWNEIAVFFAVSVIIMQLNTWRGKLVWGTFWETKKLLFY
jgi:hypothetical protein